MYMYMYGMDGWTDGSMVACWQTSLPLVYLLIVWPEWLVLLIPHHMDLSVCIYTGHTCSSSESNGPTTAGVDRSKYVNISVHRPVRSMAGFVVVFSK